jgi:hypothetical protein
MDANVLTDQLEEERRMVAQLQKKLKDCQVIEVDVFNGKKLLRGDLSRDLFASRHNSAYVL